jgi:hypothetical protein
VSNDFSLKSLIHDNDVFFKMKYFVGLFFLMAVFSCNDDTATPANPGPKLVSKDSGLVNQQSSNPYVVVDISPMDMSYLPADYPKMSVRKPLPVARVIYGRPHMQGRKIFGSLLKYGEPWRLGANEATEIEFFIPVTIHNKTIPKGKYIIYCIPYQDRWTIVFNSNLNTWGLSFDTSKDVFDFSIPVVQKDQSVEYFSMVFQPAEEGADLVMAWENVEARLPIQYREK